jgi:hypothetical protein
LIAQHLEAVRCADREPGRGRDGTGLLGAHGKRIALPLVPVPQDLRRDGEIGRYDLRQRDGDDPVRPGAGTAASLTDRSRHAAIT